MRLITVLLSVLALAGCSISPTKYEPMQDWGGYSETQVNKTMYEVRAVVNHNTQAQVAKDYALARSAQIACNNGYPFFDLQNQTFTRTTGRRPAEHFSISELTIKLHSSSDGSYYNAKTVYKNMRNQYSLPASCL